MRVSADCKLAIVVWKLVALPEKRPSWAKSPATLF